jgi:hypothetical protein
MTTRRELLLGAASAALLSAKPKVERTRLTAINDEVALTLAGSIEFLKSYGLNTIEIRELRIAPTDPGRGFDFVEPAKWKEAATMLRDAGFKVTFLNSSLGKIVIPGTEDKLAGKFNPPSRTLATVFAERIDKLKRSMEAGDALGCKRIRVFAFARLKNPQSMYPQIAEWIDELGSIAKAGGFTLLLENEGSTNVGTSSEMAAMMKLVTAKNVALCWDPQNAFGKEENPGAGWQGLPKKLIQNVQLKADGLIGEDPAKRIEWGPIMAALTKEGYKGSFCLETHKGRGEERYQLAHQSMREMLKLIGEPAS